MVSHHVARAPVGQDVKQHVALISSWPKTSQGGFMFNTCELSSVVEKGTRLGVPKDIAGNVIKKFMPRIDQ